MNEFNLKFTFEIDQKQLTFLDLKILVQEDGTVGTSLFQKPSAGNSLLHAASVPYGQYLRLRRNCSLDTDFEAEAKLLRSRFLERGYSNKCLKKAYTRAKQQDRRSLLHDPKLPKSNPGVRLITKFSGQHHQIRTILEKYWYLLTSDDMVSKHINTSPEITFKRSCSLRDNLVHSHHTSHLPPDVRS